MALFLARERLKVGLVAPAASAPAPDVRAYALNARSRSLLEQLRFLTISANNFCNSYMGGGADKRPKEGKTPMSIDEGTGVLLQETADITISGNNFGGLSSAAVWTEGKCHRLLVSGNIVTDCGRKLDKGRPLLDLEGAEDSIAKDNILPANP